MFSKIKLVVSDMDGTLLNSKGKVSPKFFQLFSKLQQHNIQFCAASGRQFNSIIDKLEVIENDIYIIAENGANVKYQNQNIHQILLDPDVATKAIFALRQNPDAHIVLCTDNGAFVESKNEKFIHHFQEYYTNYHLVDDLLEHIKTEAIFKIAVYHFTSSEKYLYPSVQHLKNDCLLKISGLHWLDISNENANKGNALQLLQQKLNIKKEETIAIGDYHNDIEMMQQSGISFAVANAHDDIKKIATFTTTSNDDFGVENVLEQVLNLNSDIH